MRNCFAKDNHPALINPSVSYVEKPSENELSFYFKFDDFKDIVYMFDTNKFDLNISKLEIKVSFNYKDFENDKIIYKY